MLNITDLNIAFKRHAALVKAVDEVSFTINAGETVALVGESGSGALLFGPIVLQITGLYLISLREIRAPLTFR